MSDTSTTDDLQAKIDQVGDLAAATKVTNVTIVLDRSGSMNRIRSDVIGGVNAFIEDQKRQTGACSLTLWTFDNVATEMVIKAKPIAGVQALTEQDFIPRGSTPLYDALGSALAEAEGRHRDGDAEIVVIVTDGLENASKEHTKAEIFDRIKELSAKQWVFSYVGADHDAYQAAGDLGIQRGSTQSFAPTSQGAARGFASVSRATGQYRGAMRAGGQSAAVYAHNAVEDFFGGVKEAEDEPDLIVEKGTGKAYKTDPSED